MRNLLPRSLALPLLVFLLGAGLLAGVMALTLMGSRDGGVQPSAIGGPFALTTHEGRRLSSEELKGRPFALFFGFTHCPEICPTTLHDIGEDLKAVGAAARDLRVFFVTVDPARDGPDLLRTYLSSFDPRITGLTGTEEEVAAAARAYRAYYRRVPSEGGYTMDHTTSVYLMDAQGRFVTATTFQEPRETRLAKLRRLVAG